MSLLPRQRDNDTCHRYIYAEGETLHAAILAARDQFTGHHALPGFRVVDWVHVPVPRDSAVTGGSDAYRVIFGRKLRAGPIARRGPYLITIL